MEIKATLSKPYTEQQRIDFIIAQNHSLGYEIRETETELQAWGKDASELTEQKKASVRGVRNSYLEQTDKFMIVDYPITDNDRESYKQYRQYLRDFTEQSNWWDKEVKTYEQWKNA